MENLKNITEFVVVSNLENRALNAGINRAQNWWRNRHNNNDNEPNKTDHHPPMASPPIVTIPGQLWLTVLREQDLHESRLSMLAASASSSERPYVVLECNQQRFQTIQADSNSTNRNPQWTSNNGPYSFNIFNPYGDRLTVWIQQQESLRVMKRNEPKILGMCEINVSQLIGQEQAWLPLRKDNKPVGQVLVQIVFLPTGEQSAALFTILDLFPLKEFQTSSILKWELGQALDVMKIRIQQTENSLSAEEEDSSSAVEEDSSSAEEEDSSSAVEEDSSSAVEEEDSSSAEEEDSSSAVEEDSSSAVEEDSSSAEEEDSSSAVEEDSSSAVEEEDSSSAEEEDSSSAEEEDSSSAVEEDSSSAVEEDSSSAVEEDSSSAVEEDSSSAVEEDSSSAVEEDSSSAVEEDSSSAVEEDSSSAVEEDSSSAVEEDSSSAVEEDSSSAVEEDSSSAVEEDSSSAVEEDSSSAVEEDSSSAVEEDSSSAVEEDSSSAVEEDSSSAVEEDSSSAVEEDSSSAVEEDSSSAVEEDSSSAVESIVNPRLLDDVRDEPTRLLPPLEGYEHFPLLSIEEATQPLHLLVGDLEQRVWFSKQNSLEPADNLSQDESAAIHLYTTEWLLSSSSLYAVLNKTLRLENRDDLKPWFSYLKLFLTALYKIPSKPQMLWRGIKGVDLSGEYPKGKKCIWWALTSCTTSVEVLKSSHYLGDHGVRTLFSIECQTGKMIKSHSEFKTEEEVLLLPGIYLEVLGQLPAGAGLQIIQMKEIEPPHPFRSSPQLCILNKI